MTDKAPILIAGLALLATSSLPAVAAEDVLELQLFEVTGSRIKRVDENGFK